MISTTKTAGIEEGKHMHTYRPTATIVGVFYILAAVTAVIGLLLYNPILNGPDYLVQGAEHKNQVILGAIMELLLETEKRYSKKGNGPHAHSPRVYSDKRWTDFYGDFMIRFKKNK